MYSIDVHLQKAQSPIEVIDMNREMLLSDVHPLKE